MMSGVILFKGLARWVIIDTRDGKDMQEGTYLFTSEEEAIEWIKEEGLTEIGKG